MTLRGTINGNQFSATFADPGGQARIRGRVWRWEYSYGFFGLINKDGEPFEGRWPNEKHPLWRAVRRWEKRNGKGRR